MNKKMLYKLFLIIIITQSVSFGRITESLFPIKSDNFKHYYAEKYCPYSVYLKPKYEFNLKKFTLEEISIPIKETFFSDKYVNESIEYYELQQFFIDKYNYRLIIYNRYGEGDTQQLNIQLNSYNEKGTIIDSLLLDSRFSYESGDVFSDFMIDDEKIVVNQYILLMLVDDEGHIIGQRARPDVRKYKDIYYTFNPDGYFEHLQTVEHFKWSDI